MLTINQLMKYLRSKHNIAVKSNQAQDLRNMGYYHGFKGYRFIRVPSQRISFTSLDEIIYVFLTIFLYLPKCPQSLILSALRAFCFCGKPRISRSIFLYFPCQSWLKSW